MKAIYSKNEIIRALSCHGQSDYYITSVRGVARR